MVFFSEAALNLAYILIPSTIFLLVVITVVFWVWISRRRQVKPSLCQLVCLLDSWRFGHWSFCFMKGHSSSKRITIADWRVNSLVASWHSEVLGICA